MGSWSKRRSYHASKPSRLCEFDDEMSFGAPPGYGAAPTLPGKMDMAWLSATRLPPILNLARVLEKFQAVKQFMEAEFIPMEHLSHRFL